MFLWTKGKFFSITFFFRLVDSLSQDGRLYDGKVPTVLATCIGFLLAAIESEDT